MSSQDSSEPLDLDRDLPVTPQDVAALRRAREMTYPMTLDEYFAFLSALPPASYETLRARRGPCGEPFVLE